jgi:hypothetical protein
VPASQSCAAISRAFANSADRVPSSSFAITMGTITACFGATRGGSTRPFESPCVMIATPIVRVVMPQLVCQAYFSSFASSRYFMPNILEKFWPRQCDVAPWTPRPLSGMNACGAWSRVSSSLAHTKQHVSRGAHTKGLT